MKLINIGIAGCLGRMGKELVRKGSLDPKLQRVVDNLHTGLPAKISTLNLLDKVQ